MRILIYGAGVIGCFYATLFSEAGYDTTIYARGKHLETFREKGLLYFRNKQIKKALKELKNNVSPNIVTMVNTLESYSTWENMRDRKNNTRISRGRAVALRETCCMQEWQLCHLAMIVPIIKHRTGCCFSE